MKLWLLRPVEGLNPNPFDRYDAYQGHVVRAETEDAARALAATGTEWEGDEGSDYRADGYKPRGEPLGTYASPWLDPAFSTCIELVPDGDAAIILSDFNAG